VVAPFPVMLDVNEQEFERIVSTSYFNAVREDKRSLLVGTENNKNSWRRYIIKIRLYEKHKNCNKRAVFLIRSGMYHQTITTL